MDINKRNEIHRITELLNLNEIKTTLVNPSGNNDYISAVGSLLSESIMGFFELNLDCKYIYCTEIIYKYAGLSTDDEYSYYDFLSSALDEDSLYVYLKTLESLCSGKMMKAEIEIPYYSHYFKSNGWTKLVFINMKNNDDSKLIIIGTVQDMTELYNSKIELTESRNMLSQLLNAIPMPILYINNEGKIEFANKAVEDILNLNSDKIINLDLDEYIEYADEQLNVTNKKLITEDKVHSTYELSAVKNDKQLEIQLDAVRIFDEIGNVVGRVLVHSDVTNRIKDLERVKKILKVNELLVEIVNLANADTTIDKLYEAMLEGIIKIIPNADAGSILRLDFNGNLYIDQTVGYNDKYATNYKIPFIDSFAYSILNENYLRSVFTSKIQDDYRDVFPTLVNLPRKFKLESNITSPINIDGKLYGIISIDSSEIDGFDDIDLNLVDFLRVKIETSISRYKELALVMEKSQLDELTGLCNRSFFNKLSESLIDESILFKNEFCLVVFDLDGLKTVNDRYGHLVGDKMIKQFANIMSEHKRKDDVIARIGGDEFIGLFSNIDKEVLNNKIIDIARDLTDTPFDYDGTELSIKFSYGIAVFPVDGERVDELIEIADKLMYAHKTGKKTDSK